MSDQVSGAYALAMPRRLERAPERFGQVPRSCGVMFVCKNCGRPQASPRDRCLEEWGRRGVVAEAAQKLRCRNCKRKGMDAFLTPIRAGLGSPCGLERLLILAAKIKPRGKVS